jgi:hypothetical protein
MNSRTAAPPPHPSPLRTALALFLLYAVTASAASAALAFGQTSLHPLTHMFLWAVLAGALGYRRLRRHATAASPTDLALALVYALGFLNIVSLASSLRSHPFDLLAHLERAALFSAALFAAGAAGFWVAHAVFVARHRTSS